MYLAVDHLQVESLKFVDVSSHVKTQQPSMADRVFGAVRLSSRSKFSYILLAERSRVVIEIAVLIKKLWKKYQQLGVTLMDDIGT